MKFREECGIFGGLSYKGDIAPYIQKGLFILQHRGQESAGITCGEDDLSTVKGKGLVMEVLTDNNIKDLTGKIGIGHVRYSTQGGSDCIHAQPYVVNYLGEKVAVAHNGNVDDAITMRRELESSGEIFMTSSDTEMILKKVVKEMRKPPSQWTFKEVADVLKTHFTGGAWSILFGFSGRVFAFRDPYGFRPMMLCESDEGVFIASEDCAFSSLSNKKITEIQPGEGVEITLNSYKIKRFTETEKHKKCVFEQIYFSKPDSNVFGRNVYTSRVELGEMTAIESPVNADIVVPVMDSGFPSATGYSHKSGIPLKMGLLRNHWVGRTFIEPEQKARRGGVLQKLTPIQQVVENKIVVLVDDSLVRGNTAREIIRMLRNSGAKEVHLRIASPMIVNVCHWGVDIPTKQELIANNFSDIKKITEFITADSLAYLSFEGLEKVFGTNGWCYSCFER